LKTCQCMEGYLDLRYSCRQFSGDSVIKVGIICLCLWHGPDYGHRMAKSLILCGPNSNSNSNPNPK
jgi:hypothetical protein